MTKSFLIAAAALLVAPAAWAQVQNSGPQGSTGGNSVGAAVAPPAPSAGTSANTNADANTGAPRQVQNAGPGGSTGGNSVGAALATPGPAPSTGTAARPYPQGGGNAAGLGASGTAQPSRTQQ